MITPTNPFENAETAEQYAKMRESHYIKKYSIYPTVLGLLEDVWKRTIIDIGCGAGDFSRMLADRGARVNAFDSSEAMLRIAERITSEEARKGKSYQNLYFWKNQAETLPWRQMGADGAVAILFFNYIRSREELHAVCKNIYDALGKYRKFIAFQNQFEDAHFEGGKVGNVDYTLVGRNNTGQNTWSLERRDLQGRSIELELTDWTQLDYESALKEAGFREIKWHQPIVSQEGMDAFGNMFWADFFKAGLFRGFEAVK
jgi:SAM-dependent methyltransferase